MFSETDTWLLRPEIYMIFLLGLKLFSFEPQTVYRYSHLVMTHLVYLELIHPENSTYTY